jgi:hypothetical protein
MLKWIIESCRSFWSKIKLWYNNSFGARENNYSVNLETHNKSEIPKKQIDNDSVYAKHQMNQYEQSDTPALQHKR